MMGRAPSSANFRSISQTMFLRFSVKCTWDALAGKTAEKFRVNPRKSWYRNLDEITTNGDYEVTFYLKRPQPYLIALLASGQSPVYPCHVPLRESGPAARNPASHRQSAKNSAQMDRWHPRGLSTVTRLAMLL